jgi:hypothetical protein
MMSSEDRDWSYRKAREGFRWYLHRQAVCYKTYVVHCGHVMDAIYIYD